MFANRAANLLHTHLAPGPLSGSDHIPIIFTVSGNPILIPAHSHYSYKNADWDSYKRTLHSKTYITDYNNKPTQDIEQEWTLIHQHIFEAANLHIPKTRYTQQFDFTPSPRTQRLLACYRRRFEANRHNLGRIHFDLNILRQHILNSWDDDRNRHWTQLVHKAEAHRKQPSVILETNEKTTRLSLHHFQPPTN